MRVFIWVGHPRSDSLSSALADAYQAGLADQHEVRRLDLSSMTFDPNLSNAYREEQALEEDLVQWQDSLKWCEHTAWFYPYWWGGTPAKMKGVLDRALLPGFGFKYHTNDPFWDKLLTGRTADVVINADTPAWYDRLLNSAPGRKQVERTVLNFTGIKARRIVHHGITKKASPKKIERWKKAAGKLAETLS